MSSARSAVERLLERLRTTKPWRAWTRYGMVRGNVLAGGIAYFAFFSLFPALALGYTTLGFVVGRRSDLQGQLTRYLNQTLAGGSTPIIGSKAGEGLVTIDALVQPHVLTIAGVLGAVTLLLAGMGWVDAMRQGIRAVFGQPDDGNPVLVKLRALGSLAALGLLVIVSVVASVAVTALGGSVLSVLRLGDSPGAEVVVTVAANLVLLVIDTGIFLMFFWMLAGVPVPFADLYTAALAGGLGLGLLKISGGVLLRSALGNRLLVASSLIIALLLWMNLVARLTLIAAAWAATTAQDRGHLQLNGRGSLPPELPELPGETLTRTPTLGVRATDRVTLVAGAILGATVVLALHSLSRARRWGDH